MTSTKKSTQETFYQLLMEMCTSEDYRKKVLPELGSVFQGIFREYEDIEYPTIFRIVSDSSLNRVDIETLLEILVEVEKQVTEEYLKKMMQKMRRHFLLSYEQKVSFDRLDAEFRNNLMKSEEVLVSVQSQTLEIKEDLKNAHIMLNTIDDESTKVYVQFVTILGIFTAIVVSVFGGLSIVSGVFDKLDQTPMWKVILTGSMVSIFVLCLLFLLTRWISTIVRKTYGHDSEQSFMQIVTNNGAFATGIFIFCYLIIAAVVFSSSEATMRLKQIVNAGDALPILLVLALPILGGAAVFIKTIDLRKYTKKRRHSK